MIITEDSHSGYQFFNKVCEKKEKVCLSADGKSNIFSMILQQKSSNCILVIADGAAFGAEMEKIMYLMQNQKNFVLYLPESFEWLILASGLLNDKKIKDILEQPENYIESAEYFSWEQYFTHILIEKTRNSYLEYSKKTLNGVYLQDKEMSIILNKIEVKI